MDFLWDAITGWLKDILVSGIMSNLSGMFDSENEKVGSIATQVGTTPQAWNVNIFNMVQSLSQNVVLPVAGVILAFVMTLELVQILMDKNNFHDIETVVFFRWIFKTACAILIVSNTWNMENLAQGQAECKAEQPDQHKPSVRDRLAALSVPGQKPAGKAKKEETR